MPNTSLAIPLPFPYPPPRSEAIVLPKAVDALNTQLRQRLQLAGRVFFERRFPSATCFDHPPATADDVAAMPEPAREAGKANTPTASSTGRRLRYHP
jgi:hypothetical protein